MLKILGLRTGFATNSSSTHTVVLLPPSKVGKVGSRPSSSSDGYGWDNFVLVDPEEKIRYLAAQFFMSYWNRPEVRADLLARFEREIPWLKDEMDEVGRDGWGDDAERRPVREHESNPIYVDHQSVIGFNSDRYDPVLVEALIGFFKSPRVAVFGGNDNGGHPNPPKGSQEVTWIENMRDRSGRHAFRVRKDGDFWAGFNPSDGTRIRWAFSEDPSAPARDIDDTYTKASAPELVDLKITNWCDTGCAFCYQSSTVKGRHGKTADILRIVEILGSVDVFEIAIGGGEPTAHPDFVQILRAIRAQGMVPNFTTLSGKWLENEETVKAVAECVGGIGVSCHDASGLDLVKRIAKAMRDAPEGYGVKVTAQHVVGAAPLNATTEFVKAACADNIDLLLLGYKEVGFGAKQERTDGANLDVYMALGLRDVTKHSWNSIAVDTALAERHPGLIKALGAPKALVHGLKEGAFSCYVDGVTRKMGPSSYVPAKAMEPMPMEREAFLAAFARY